MQRSLSALLPASPSPFSLSLSFFFWLFGTRLACDVNAHWPTLTLEEHHHHHSSSDRYYSAPKLYTAESTSQCSLTTVCLSVGWFVGWLVGWSVSVQPIHTRTSAWSSVRRRRRSLILFFADLLQSVCVSLSAMVKFAYTS